jgi:hypothetical protein
MSTRHRSSDPVLKFYIQTDMSDRSMELYVRKGLLDFKKLLARHAEFQSLYPD